jgi:NADPH:quinone reductase-like Zn-dependent oxidoreductase
MKALLLDSPGAPGTLRVGEVAIPQPGPGEVRVQVQAAGLNPVDYKMMAGGVSSWRYPFIPGLDVAGVIDAVGDGVEGWQQGDAVFYHGNYGRPGGFAEFTVTTARTLVRTPQGLSAIDAAALPCAGFTAYQALVEKLHIQSGQTILVQGGAGGVGGFAIQIAAKLGLDVITTAAARNAECAKAVQDWARKAGGLGHRRIRVQRVHVSRKAVDQRRLRHGGQLYHYIRRALRR